VTLLKFDKIQSVHCISFTSLVLLFQDRLSLSYLCIVCLQCAIGCHCGQCTADRLSAVTTALGAKETCYSEHQHAVHHRKEHTL